MLWKAKNKWSSKWIVLFSHFFVYRKPVVSPNAVVRYIIRWWPVRHPIQMKMIRKRRGRDASNHSIVDDIVTGLGDEHILLHCDKDVAVIVSLQGRKMWCYNQKLETYRFHYRLLHCEIHGEMDSGVVVVILFFLFRSSTMRILMMIVEVIMIA